MYPPNMQYAPNYGSMYNQSRNHLDYGSLNSGEMGGDNQQNRKDEALSGFGPNRDLPKNWKSDLD